MKAIMYHYVQPSSSGMPYFRYLHLNDFKRQLNFFNEKYGFIKKDEFEEAIDTCKPHPGVILTFDDGFSGHYKYVFPELVRKNIWGCFYISTSPLISGKLLDVHRIHLLLGKLGGHLCMQLLDTVLEDDMLSYQHVNEFHSLTYRWQDNDQATTLFKRTLNYYISYEWRERILDRLISEILSKSEEKSLVQEYYLTPSQIKSMSKEGMIIGSHSVNHVLLSKLSVEEQRNEIKESFDVLSNIIDEPVTSFCYPYGGFHSFTVDTMSLLQEAGSIFAFNVESRNITNNDLENHLLELPRYDCNEYLYGKVSIGDE